MNTKRRSRMNAARSKSPDQLADGVYANPHFLHASAGLLGTAVEIDTTNGSRYGGILTTFSSQFDVVLEYAHSIHNNEISDIPDPQKIMRRMIFSPKNIVHMMISNIDPDYASKDGFQTDTSISKFDRNGQSLGEKVLQPWISDCNGDDRDLSLGTESGWDANDMFKTNEQVYGVKSSFDHSLSGYTLALERSESKSFKDAEARAARIASEIESSSKTTARLELENGDEEDKYAAVIRDDGTSPRSQDKTNKYISPARRQPGSFHGRLTPRTAPFPPGRGPPIPPIEEPVEVSAPEPVSPAVTPTNCDDNRNNNSCSPSVVPPVNSPAPNQPLHPRPNNSNNNNNGARNKTYMMPNYAYGAQQPRYPAPNHPAMVTHRQISPTPPPPQLQHAPPPPQQPLPIVFGPPMPPNHAHHSNMQPVNAIQQETVNQPMSVQAVNHPSNQPVAMLHAVDQSAMRDPTITHVHLPPHGVAHVHPAVPVVQGYVQAPREHDLELRGHRNTGIRGPGPRVFQTANKRFPAFPPPLAPTRKQRADEVQELAEFSTNLKLTSEEELEEKQESPPPMEQWGKARTPPSNSSPDDNTSALKKSTLNPNAKEFVYNPSAKPFTPRPVTTPGPSRPHTPQTPAQPFGFSPGPVPTVMMPAGTYVMQSTAFPHQAQPPRLQMTPRPEITSSQMQVAAATGQPLLAPAPMQRFMAPYPTPPPQPYQQMVRMVHSQAAPVMFHPDSGQHIQYMSPHAPGPHPGGQFPQPQPQQFPATMVYSMPTTMLQYFQHNTHPQPGQQQHVQVIVPNP